MKKVFILPQFGKPHPWTQAFIDRVQINADAGWEWWIFTPNKLESKGNVKVFPMTAKDFADLCLEKLGHRPDFFITESGVPSVHITDFCIMYGVIFEDYLKGVDFWGMCGWDTVMGRLDHFLSDEELDQWDVWSDDMATINGTFCLFRNNDHVNNLFKKIMNWEEIIVKQPICPRCVHNMGNHTLLGSDEYAMTEVMKIAPVRFGYPKYYPLHSHDRMENHQPEIKLDVKEDGSLWELMADNAPPNWIHARPFLGREIMYYHFMVTKRWPLDDRFLEYDSKWDATYGPKLRGRYNTMRLALNLLYQQEGHNIVETGCIRRPEDYGGGNSTFIFAEFVHKYGGHLTTIDIEKDHIEMAKELTQKFDNSVTYLAEDSLEALPKLTQKIDLLYLDSFDAPETGDATESQEHNLKEFKAVEHLLQSGSLVLIDDNDMENGGKSKLTKEYLESTGDWKVLFNGAQSLWMRN